MHLRSSARCCVNACIEESIKFALKWKLFTLSLSHHVRCSLFLATWLLQLNIASFLRRLLVFLVNFMLDSTVFAKFGAIACVRMHLSCARTVLYVDSFICETQLCHLKIYHTLKILTYQYFLPGSGSRLSTFTNNIVWYFQSLYFSSQQLCKCDVLRIGIFIYIRCERLKNSVS